MTEGWNGNDYLISFAESERPDAESRYAFSALLPGYGLVGLRGWDGFIVRDGSGNMYCVPSVPLDPQYLTPYDLDLEWSLSPDPRIAGKVKWYVKPIVFGGDPSEEPNLAWVNHEQHGQLVRWWNDRYRSLQGNRS